jgi:hypothetical protein
MCNDYIRVEILEDATHWIALEDNRYHWGSFTPNKPYKIDMIKREFKNAWNKDVEAEEFWIKDDEGKLFNEPWLVQKGYLVKKI